MQTVQTRGRPPAEATIRLRRILEQAQRRGAVKDEEHYRTWYRNNSAASASAAYGIVRREYQRVTATRRRPSRPSRRTRQPQA